MPISPRITIEHIPYDQHFAKVTDDYRSMWEYDPGEEREVSESHRVAKDYFDHRADVITVAAFRPDANGEKQWIGSAFGYAKRRDHLVEPEKQAAIASVFVHEDARRNGAATLMVKSLQKEFTDRGYKSIQLYASPEGAAVYQKCGFTPGDEMRLKSLQEPQSPSADSSVFVRKADLNNRQDRKFIINLEHQGTGVRRTVRSQAEALKNLQSPVDGAKPTAFIACQKYGKVRRVIHRALGLSQERRVGSAVAGLWSYPVPDTFRPEMRKDLFVPGVRSKLTNSAQLQNVQLALIKKIVEHAQTNGFTQVNVQNAGAARAQLTKAGFTNGIHMHYTMPSSS